MEFDASQSAFSLAAAGEFQFPQLPFAFSEFLVLLKVALKNSASVFRRLLRRFYVIPAIRENGRRVDVRG